MRLKGFDYSKPYYYMVTLKKINGLPPFCRIVGDESLNYTDKTPITKAILNVIQTFHMTWPVISPITCFTIMPDHLHLIIRIRDIEKRKTLSVLVRQLITALEHAYFSLVREPASQSNFHLFEQEWHDWIILKEGQLKTFCQYIRENPKRSWLRKSHPQYFSGVKRVSFLNREWFAYGDITLLESPIMIPFQCSRKWQPNGQEWQMATMQAARIGPGGVGVSTFLSPCEKTCGNEIYKAGGSLIILSPEGFGERWHPPREKERLCAAGRLLYLSLYPAETSKPDKATLYKRCHEMGDIVIAQLKN